MKAMSIPPAISLSAASCGGKSQQLADDGVDLGPFQDLERKRAAAASFRTNRNAAAAECLNAPANLASIENP